MRACQEAAAQDRANCPSQLLPSDLLLKVVWRLDCCREAMARDTGCRITLRRARKGRFPMSATVFAPDQRSRTFSSQERAPLLRWLIFTGVTIFAAVLLWRYGFFQLMIASDRTYISFVISILYIGASLHCLWRTIAIAREGDEERRAERMIEAGGA